jgi:hypothetical protein
MMTIEHTILVQKMADSVTGVNMHGATEKTSSSAEQSNTTLKCKQTNIAAHPDVTTAGAGALR